jgi:hypothetical protein
MSTIPKVLEGQVEDIFQVKYNTKVFLFTIHKSKDTHVLYIGGPHTYCINFQIYLKDSVYKDYIDVSTCLLDHFYYNHLCSISGGFQRGVDTGLLFQLGVSYIQNTYPHVSRLKLKDYSSRECNNGYTVNLYEKFYITTGQTWYQKRYHAYLNETDKRRFEIRDREFTMQKAKIDWNTMKKFIGSSELPNLIESIYNTTTTWQDFFSELETKMGVSEFSEFISPWISAFLSSTLKYDFTAPFYYIDFNTIQQLKYTSMVGGVRKLGFTRRRKMVSPKQLL